MNKIRHNIAGFIFAGLGLYFLYLDLGHMHHGHGGSTLLGLGEMTWMWFTMAVVHFFLNDCQCKTCKGKD
tara:strand:- start:104 stop:313 length:210 start_codon:yes stop_codon:yes gene_type:complete